MTIGSYAQTSGRHLGTKWHTSGCPWKHSLTQVCEGASSDSGGGAIIVIAAAAVRVIAFPL
jgi:hypothetical protein